jgi:dsDNA-binding SOS-regulon protein
MKIWVTALIPTRGADTYEGVRTGAALSERDAYLELLSFFDTAEDVTLDRTSTNEEIAEVLNSHREVQLWKIEEQEVSLPGAAEPVTVRVRWGSIAARHDNPDLNTPDEYKFDTQAEADAFLQGMDEADGWSDWTVNPGPDDEEEGQEDEDVLKTYQADWHIKSIDDGTVVASGQMRMPAASVQEAAEKIDEQIRETRPEADLDDITVVVETPEVVDEDDEEEDDSGDPDICSTPGCGNSTADGEGWDGKCGSCADKDFEKSPEGKELLADGDDQPAS